MTAGLSVAAAVGSAFAAWGAAWYARQQASAARAQNSLNFVAGQARDWESALLLGRRAEAAGDLLAGDGAHSQAVYELMLRFESIGILLERRALDPVIVWSQLSTFVLHYR